MLDIPVAVRDEAQDGEDPAFLIPVSFIFGC